MKMSDVLLKTSRRFMENKPSFGLCGWVKRDYLLKCRRKWFAFSVLRT